MEGSIKTVLTCNTCNELTDIPIIINCCTRGNQELHCLKCIYKAYMYTCERVDLLSDNFKMKGKIVESLNVCRCKYIINETNQFLPLLIKKKYFYSDTPVDIHLQNLLMGIRNALHEEMTCVHFPNCNKVFNKCEDLKKHILEECIYAPKSCTKNGCSHYNYKFKIEKHVEMDHTYIECHVCQTPVVKSSYKEHIAEHASQLLLTTHEGYLSKCLVPQNQKEFVCVTRDLHLKCCMTCNDKIAISDGNFCGFVDSMIQSFE